MKHAHYTTVVASCFLGFWLPLMVALSLGTITQSNKAIKMIRTLIPLCCIVFYNYLRGSPKHFVHIIVVISADSIPTVCGRTMQFVRFCIRYPTLSKKLNGKELLIGFFGSFVAHLN